MITQLKSPEAKKRAEKLAKRIYMDLLREGKEVYLNTSGCSMYPFVKGYDRMTVAPLKEDDIKIGDIIAIDNEGRNKAWFYVHRVIDVFKIDDKKMYVTKGDANREGIDEPVGFERVVGKLTSVERRGLKINYENPLWQQFLNKRIARISVRHGRKLRTFAPYISLALEWKWFLSKLRSGVRRLDEPICNAEEFLLICARNDLNKKSIRKAKDLLKAGVDWEFFMENAIRSGLAFLFYSSLKKIDSPELIPKEFVDKLKITYLYTTQRVYPKYQETKDLLRSFFEGVIPVVPLKGPMLSKRLYGDVAARGISVDIDLLVKEKDREAARKVLEKKGYSFMPQSEARKHLGQYIFRKSDGETIDLHWEINPVVSSDERMDGLWKGTRLQKDEDTRYYEFKKEELLLHLSVHFVDSANLVQFRYIADIHALLTKYRNKLDWESIVEKAKRWKLANTLYITLVLSQALFNSYIPDKVLVRLKPGRLKRLLISFLADRKVILHRNSFPRKFLTKFLCYILFQTLEAESPKDFFAIIFPPKEKIPGKTHLQRFIGGVSKLVRGLK